MMRCNKTPEVSIKGKGQTAGEVKFFAYSDFADFNENDVLFRLKDGAGEREAHLKPRRAAGDLYPMVGISPIEQLTLVRPVGGHTLPYLRNSAAAQAHWKGLLQTYEFANKLDLSRLRVLKYGQVTDDGNGG